MKHHNYQKTGDYHFTRGEPCQDAILSVEDETYMLVSIADGVTVCTQGKTGAEQALQGVWNFIQIEKENVFQYEPKKLSYLLIEHVLYYLETAIRSKGGLLRDYSSTLSFACIEKRTGRTVVGNLGDGIVIGVIGGQYYTLLNPVRYNNCPPVTTVKQAYKAMAVHYCDLSLGDSILLGSDGFFHAIGNNCTINDCIRSSLENFNFELLDNSLSGACEPDDCTYIAIRRTRT